MATVFTPLPTGTQMSDEEFVAFYAARPHAERWQLIDGDAIMMNPPKLRHQKIGGNLAWELNALFRVHMPNMSALQEAGLLVPGVQRFRPQADVAVIDDTVDLDTSWADRFFLAAEVLSESNSARMIERKRKRYMQHPLNQYVLVIAQLKPRVEVFARTKNWQPYVLTRLDDVLDLSDLMGAAASGGAGRHEISVPLFRLYAGTPVVSPKPAGS
jgi:Uma2 family endonuclease